MRVAALVAVVALLVGGGVWLSQRSAADGEPTPQEAVQDTPVEDAIPAGFEAVPYLSDTRKTTFTGAEPLLDPSKDYQAVIITNQGRLVIDLFEEQTPETVNNFVFLALNHYYDGVVFHRVLDGFMAQTGDPTGTGRGGPGYSFDDEFSPDLGHDSRGVVSMANAGPGTNGSQFFITFDATPFLDGRHTVFGRLVEGDEVLDAITRIDPSNPQAIAGLDDTLASLAEQGIELEGPREQTLREKLESSLGAVPVQGESFTVDGLQGVMGAVGGEVAAGFYPQPDLMERVVIIVRDRS